MDGLQGSLKLYNLARRYTTYGSLRDDTLKVAYAMYLIVDTLAELWFAIVVLYHIQSLVDGFLVLEWEHQPAAQQSSTHRTHCLVDDIQ